MSMKIWIWHRWPRKFVKPRVPMWSIGLSRWLNTVRVDKDKNMINLQYVMLWEAREWRDSQMRSAVLAVCLVRYTKPVVPTSWRWCAFTLTVGLPPAVFLWSYPHVGCRFSGMMRKNTLPPVTLGPGLLSTFNNLIYFFTLVHWMGCYW